MSTALGHRPFLSQPGLVAGTSVLAGAALVVLLWIPWQKSPAEIGRPLRLYCAAGMSKPVQKLLEDYEQTYGVKVEVSFEGSGSLLAKIRASGGQGDLYLAADASHIRLARKYGLVREVLPVAILKPVLAVNAKTHARLEKEGKPLTTAKDLLRDDLQVVLANPELASIGQLGKQLLQATGIWQQLELKMRGGNARVALMGTVQEVAQALQTREDTLGIVWSAVARQFPGIHGFTPPEFALAQEPLQVGVLANTDQPAAALKLARFLSASDRGGKVFQSFHYDLVSDPDPWEEKQTLQLAAGAMLKPALDDIIANFEIREGVQVKTSYAGCGDLVAMMKAAKAGDNELAFPDIYFACDVTFLEMVDSWFERGRVVSANDLVLLVAKGNPHRVKNLDDLARQDLRVGLGHPTKSALGKLTMEMLAKRLPADLYQKIKDPETGLPALPEPTGHLLVSKIRLGALDLAVVYRSNALSHPSNLANHLDIVEIPGLTASARQPFAVAKDSPRRQLARRLLQSLETPAARDRFREMGFTWLLEAE